MKKSGRKVLSVILTVVMAFALLPIISFPMRAKAETTSDGFNYLLYGYEIEITGYEGTNPNVVIPKYIKGIPVSDINSIDNINVKSIEFEGYIKNIYSGTFTYHSNLERVKFDNGVGDIGNRAFYKCSNLKSIEINGNVGNIEMEAFSNCSSLQSVEINGNVENICSDAFLNCSNLERVKFDGDVGDICDNAFYNCSSLQRLEFGGNVGSIGNGAFALCSNLKTVIIPSTSKIDNAFDENTLVIKYENIDGKKFVYTGQDLSDEVRKAIIDKDSDEYKIVFYKGEKEVNEIKSIGDYTAEILLKNDENPDKYNSMVKMNFIVGDYEISDSTINSEISQERFVYNGYNLYFQITGKIKVKVIESNSVLPSENYQIEFSNDGGQNFSGGWVCSKAGSYQAKIVGKQPYYKGEVSGICFSIDPTPLTITASDASKDCDGNTLESKGYRIDGLVGNDSIKSINVTGSQTGPGKSENVPSDAVIVNAAGEDVTDCYDITYVKGTLTVTEHVFDQEIATDEHMASPATQNSPAKYFKSCLCGENGTETFEAGDPLPTYTITFEANGGIVDIEVNGTNEEYKLDSLPTPTYEGYDFKGWYTNAIGGTEITTDTVFGANMTIYAHWEKKEEPKPAQDGNGENPEKPEDPEKPQEPEPEIPEKDWLDDLWLALHIADELGGAQTVEYSGDFALSYDIMNYLVEHPSITFIYHVTYEGVEYTIVIPAGKAISSPEIPWYGPLWLLANYGNGNVPTGIKENGVY
ncbi:MAG: leucine-rich repeat protein [Lachnospiraceae bacterium]|nr:leucine-rich repeat protein [Lachnospiraceae bacterium]